MTENEHRFLEQAESILETAVGNSSIFSEKSIMAASALVHVDTMQRQAEALENIVARLETIENHLLTSREE